MADFPPHIRTSFRYIHVRCIGEIFGASLFKYISYENERKCDILFRQMQMEICRWEK